MEEKEAMGVEDLNHDAMIIQDGLDEQSAYSHVYLTAVYHDDVDELERALKKEFFKINTKGKITLDEFLLKDNESFDDEFNDLSLKEKSKNEDLKEEGPTKGNNKLFYYAFAIALLSATIQCTFILTIIKEYFDEAHHITSDPELITIRIIAFMTLTITLWIELCNGRKILLQGIYNPYMFRSQTKRILSTVMGGVQIFTALSCYFCSSQLISLTTSVIDCVSDFTTLIILIEIDNWIGDYFLNTSEKMLEYTGEKVRIITVLRKKDYGKYVLADCVLDLIIVATFIVSIIPLYEAITFMA